MTEIAFNSAVDIAKLIKRGELSSREALELYLARVDKYNPALNAVIVLRADEARREADLADAAIKKGLETGPLHGVPMTVKESFDVTGLPTTWGVEKLRHNVATQDALAVRRLREAGAIIFGKTNVPFLLSDWQSYNSIYGTTNNPWDLQRSPGGSSGGSAAALAAGLTAFELGSDIGSSIRNPAHYCGVYGHKTTYAIASPRGQAPPGILSVPDLSVIGPLGRSAVDLELGLNIIAGPDEIDAAGWRLALPAARATSLRGLRVAVLRDSTIAPVAADVGKAFTRLVDFLAEEGAVITEKLPFDLSEMHRLYILVLRATTSRNQTGAEAKQYLREVEGLSEKQDDYWTLARRGVAMGHREWLLRNEQRHKIRHAWHDFFRDIDVLICPVASTAAVKHDHKEPRHERFIDVDGDNLRGVDQLFWAGLATLGYLPATSIPIGLTPSALPVGAQIIGPQYGDLSTITVAKLLERYFQRFTPPPNF
jgi:amidase